MKSLMSRLAAALLLPAAGCCWHKATNNPNPARAGGGCWLLLRGDESAANT
jgi:hypothetical protein